MLNIGDTVVFGTEGIFTIEQTTQKEICGRKADYYVLKSKEKDNSTVYLPINNKDLVSKARPLMTETEICELLRKVSYNEDLWIEDHKERKEKFLQILQNGDRREIIMLAGTIYHRQQSQLANHRKLNISDEKVLREAERIIKMEFAFVLNIAPDEVGEYIRSQIGITK